MRRQLPLPLFEQVGPVRRLQHRDRPERRPGRGKVIEPGELGKIVATRNRWRAGRIEPGAQPDRGAFHQLRIVVGRRKVEPDLDWRLHVVEPSRQPQPHPIERRLFFPLDHPRGHRIDAAARERRRAGQRRFGPDRHAPCRDHQAQPDQRGSNVWKARRSPALPATEGQPRKHDRRARAQHGDPLNRRRQGEPQRDPHTERHGQPGRALETPFRQEVFYRAGGDERPSW